MHAFLCITMYIYKKHIYSIMATAGIRVDRKVNFMAGRCLLLPESLRRRMEDIEISVHKYV